jgi:hypothetical protein
MVQACFASLRPEVQTLVWGEKKESSHTRAPKSPNSLETMIERCEKLKTLI